MDIPGKLLCNHPNRRTMEEHDEDPSGTEIMDAEMAESVSYEETGHKETNEHGRTVPGTAIKITGRLLAVLIAAMILSAGGGAYLIIEEMGNDEGREPDVKILGDGKISKPLNVRSDAFSRSAKKKITEAGGKAEIKKC